MGLQSALPPRTSNKSPMIFMFEDDVHICFPVAKPGLGRIMDRKNYR